MHSSLHMSIVNFTSNFLILCGCLSATPNFLAILFISLNDLILANICHFPDCNSPFAYHNYEFPGHPTPVPLALWFENLPFNRVLTSLLLSIIYFLQWRWDSAFVEIYWDRVSHLSLHEPYICCCCITAFSMCRFAGPPFFFLIHRYESESFWAEVILNLFPSRVLRRVV